MCQQIINATSAESTSICKLPYRGILVAKAFNARLVEGISLNLTDLFAI